MNIRKVKDQVHNVVKNLRLIYSLNQIRDGIDPEL